MTFKQELEMMEHISGGTSWLEEEENSHPFFKPEIDYEYRPAKREQNWVTVEQLLAHACVISGKVKNGSLGKFDAYMMVIGKWPEMFDYEDEIILEKPSLRDFFDIIKQF